ncbi:MAG: DUF2330 domain-containing protein [Planctomycetales bacterium]|nr:DUF2330 domain-containing protein [Planctomycetales bacterium]
MTNQTTRLRILSAFLIAMTLFQSTTFADPCGMVPPITVEPTVPLVRVGDQNTYVFYKDGIETIVLRPGFSGKVEEFGMLIPFPTPPSIRKVSDDIFPHIAAAIDPPEIVIKPIVYYRFLAETAPAAAADASGLKFDAVRVIKQEAVGMYAVAVLQAGSARALQRWMDDHQFKYPTGMDKACEDYVDDGWCFVAVKTRVGQKQAADPRPGQKEIDVALPDGATFDGHVQAMGFRFRVDRMIVPMRLSTFNEGDLKNTVYILTDEPTRIANLPTSLVVRQLPGEQLFKNVTELLPLRAINQKLTAQLIEQYKSQRDPEPKNGAAKELFASDLLAVQNETLNLAHEEQEKALLSISESLGLRGKEIDDLHAATSKKQRDATIDAALADLKKMTLTVVDGDFPRDVLANENLTFSAYAMDASKNTPRRYDAKVKKATPAPDGELHLGSLDRLDTGPSSVAGFAIGSLLVSVGVMGLVLTPKQRWLLPFLLVGLSTWATTAEAAEVRIGDASNEHLIKLLDDSHYASQAAKELTSRGQDALEILLATASNGNSLAHRGWAISCLGQIGGPQTDVALAKIYQDDTEEQLVRTWAAAARIASTDSAELLLERAHLVARFPATGRPLAKKLTSLLSSGQAVSAAALLEISLKVPQLQSALAEPIMETGADALVEVLTTSPNQEVRRQAAAYLGTLASQTPGVADAINAAYAFDKDASMVPWADGPLFIPRLSWQQEKARTLVGSLIRWHVWCDVNDNAEGQQQIHNNLRSLYLAGAAGYQSPGFGDASTVQWLKTWSAVVGKAEIRTLLSDQGISKTKYGF